MTILESHESKLEMIRERIAVYPDFPKPGILFQDFTPILGDYRMFSMVIDLFANRYQDLQIDAVIGLEGRGFPLGAALALRLGVGFVLMRKKGKLPGETIEASYEKEYGEDFFQMSRNALNGKNRVLIIDDLIATGGSGRAAVELVRSAGSEPVEFAAVIVIPELKGEANIGVPCFTLVAARDSYL